MSAADDAKQVSKNITANFEKLRAEMYALAKAYAAECKADFRNQQPDGQLVEGEFWINQTTQARNNVFTRSFENKYSIGFLMAHQMLYGIYLELANDRKHEAIRPLVEKWGKELIDAVKELL